jgi:hypothetical protein
MNGSDFLKLHDIALADTLAPDVLYHYRAICRWYSEKFHTPLHIVEHELSPAYVVRHYYESNMATMDEEDIEQLIFQALNPDAREEEFDDEDAENFVKLVENVDKARQKKSTTAKAQKKPAKPRKQSLKSRKKPSGALGATPPVKRVYNEPPPPEAGSDPDASLDSTPVLRTESDDPDSL